MLFELDERSPQRSFPEQDQMGQALLFNRSHPALRKSVQVGAAWRKSQTLYASCCQGLPEFGAELGIAIVQPVATAVQMSRLLECRVASCWAHPTRIGMICDSSDGDLMNNEPRRLSTIGARLGMRPGFLRGVRFPRPQIVAMNHLPRL